MTGAQNGLVQLERLEDRYVAVHETVDVQLVHLGVLSGQDEGLLIQFVEVLDDLVVGVHVVDHEAFQASSLLGRVAAAAELGLHASEAFSASLLAPTLFDELLSLGEDSLLLQGLLNGGLSLDEFGLDLFVGGSGSIVPRVGLDFGDRRSLGGIESQHGVDQTLKVFREEVCGFLATVGVPEPGMVIHADEVVEAVVGLSVVEGRVAGQEDE